MFWRLTNFPEDVLARTELLKAWSCKGFLSWHPVTLKKYSRIRLIFLPFCSPGLLEAEQLKVRAKANSYLRYKLASIIRHLHLYISLNVCRFHISQYQIICFPRTTRQQRFCLFCPYLFYRFLRNHDIGDHNPLHSVPWYEMTQNNVLLLRRLSQVQ